MTSIAKKAECPRIYIYKNFCNAYKAYHELGGNDMVTHMKEDVDKLDICETADDE